MTGSRRKIKAADSEKEYDSDALDVSDDQSQNNKKRRRASSKKRSPRKKQKADSDDGDELEHGQEVVGVVVQAPKTGQGRWQHQRLLSIITSLKVPPGQISQNTLDFLNHLKDPKCNDRVWYVIYFLLYSSCSYPGLNFMVWKTLALSGSLDSGHFRASLPPSRKRVERLC